MTAYPVPGPVSRLTDHRRRALGGSAGGGVAINAGEQSEEGAKVGIDGRDGVAGFKSVFYRGGGVAQLGEAVRPAGPAEAVGGPGQLGRRGRRAASVSEFGHGGGQAADEAGEQRSPNWGRLRASYRWGWRPTLWSTARLWSTSGVAGRTASGGAIAEPILGAVAKGVVTVGSAAAGS